MPDKLLNYDVVKVLGEGARSTIYSVIDPVTKRNYALKHVIRAETKDLRFIEQMEAEFEISRQFNHPNLRRSFELKVNRSMLLKVSEAFLLMELIDGRPLDVRPPGSLLEIIETFVQVAAGLRAMHQLGYVHCDIKPNNILRNDVGEVKIIDFGQSCRFGTIKARIQGTPDYIAPEQVNRRPVTLQTDIYNLGATLYWALTGKPIPTLYTVNKKGDNSFLLHSTIQTPADVNSNIPPALSNLVMDCISTPREKRPADMDAVTNRLEIARHTLYKRSGITPPSSAAPSAEAVTPPPDPAIPAPAPAAVAEPNPQPPIELSPQSSNGASQSPSSAATTTAPAAPVATPTSHV